MHTRLLSFDHVLLLIQRGPDGLHVSLHRRPEPDTPVTVGADTMTWQTFSPSHHPQGFMAGGLIELPDPLATWTHLTDADLSLHGAAPTRIFRRGIARLLPDPRPVHPHVHVDTAAEVHVTAQAGELNATMRGVLLSRADEHDLHGRLEGRSQFIPHGPLDPALQAIWNAWSAGQKVTFTAAHPPLPLNNLPGYHRLSGEGRRMYEAYTDTTLADTRVLLRGRSPQKLTIQNVEYDPQAPGWLSGVTDARGTVISGHAELNLPPGVTLPPDTHTVHLSIPGTDRSAFGELHRPRPGEARGLYDTLLTRASSFHLHRLNFPTRQAQVRPATPDELATLEAPLRRAGHHATQNVLNAFREATGVTVRLHPTIPGLLTVQGEQVTAAPIVMQGGLYHTVMRSAKGDVRLHTDDPTGPWYMEPVHVRSEYYAYPTIEGTLDHDALAILERQLSAHQDAPVQMTVDGHEVHLTIGDVTRTLPRWSPLAEVTGGPARVRIATQTHAGEPGPARWVDLTAEGLTPSAYLTLTDAQGAPLHVSGHPTHLPPDELSGDAPVWTAGNDEHQALSALLNYHQALWTHASPGEDVTFADGTLLRTHVTPGGVIVTAHGHPDGPADATYTGVPGVAALGSLSLDFRAPLWPSGLQDWAARHVGTPQGRAAIRDLLSLHGQFPTRLTQVP